MDLSKREYIVEECKKAAELAKELSDEKAMHLVIQKLAKNALSRIGMIEKICQVDKYNLFFNGQVGVGKTTAISHLTGLVDYSCFEEGKKIGELPLLTVGGGRTTVCEMKIVPTKEQSRISLLKMEREKFEKYVEEFCSTLLREENGGQGSLISAEVERFICNMAKYPKENGKASRNEKDIKNYIQETGISVDVIDKASLLEAVNRNIDYENRNQIEIVFTEGEFGDWLKETLSKVNNGLFPDIPFVRELSIYINSEDINLDIPEYVASIIDTKGMEAESGIRGDLVKQMEKETSITVMCDEVPAFGGNSDMLTLLKHVLGRSGKDLYHRTFLLGLEKNAQLEDVNDADGLREKGMEIKRGEAAEKLREENILLDKEHINFYSTLYGLECTNSNKILTIDKAKYDREKEQFWNELKKAIVNMYEKYDIEISDILLNLKKMSSGEIGENVVSKFEDCKRDVDKLQNNMKTNSNFLSQLENEIRSIHPGSIRACVNRWGMYDDGFEIYFVSSKIGGDEFERKCGKERDILKGLIEKSFDENDETEKICMDAIKGQIDTEYSRYYKENCEHYKRIVCEVLENNPLWGELQTYWGDGIGHYKDRIIYKIENELKSKDLEKKLESEDCCKKYMEEIKLFLDIYRS